MTLKSLMRAPTRAAILTFAVTFSSPSHAEVPLSGADHLFQALQGFITRLDETQRSKILPRLANSKDAPVLEALWDARSIIGNAPYSATDLPVLMDIIQQQAQITKTYVLFAPDQNKPANTVQNSTAFQDEISRASVAMLSFVAAALEAASDYAQKLKKDDSYQAQVADLIRLRLGLQQVINGTTLLLRNHELKPDNQQRIVLALAENATVIAQAISLQDRKALIAVIEEVKPNFSTIARTDADRFIKAMSNTDCTDLCALK